MNSQSDLSSLPQPGPMPHDAEEYAHKYSLTHFINSYYQIRDCLSYAPKHVLVIGVGVGLEPILLRNKFGIEVITLDIDSGFKPDCVGSVHMMPMFSDLQFDVCIVSHVLEHLPFRYFEESLREIARIARHAVIFLPYGGRHLEWKFSYAQRFREYKLALTIPPLRKISGESLDLQQGEHYWECGYRNFDVKKITAIMARYFSIDACYHNPEWKYSINFNLSSSYVIKPSL
jgi:hypothetical protein